MMLNSFVLTMQSKITMMQNQIFNLQNTIKQLQEKIDSLNAEIEHMKTSEPRCLIPSIYQDEYIDSLQPIIPDEIPFVLVDRPEAESDSESDSEYDSDDN